MIFFSLFFLFFFKKKVKKKRLIDVVGRPPTKEPWGGRTTPGTIDGGLEEHQPLPRDSKGDHSWLWSTSGVHHEVLQGWCG
jgi:hypothetical protein